MVASYDGGGGEEGEVVLYYDIRPAMVSVSCELFMQCMK